MTDYKEYIDEGIYNIQIGRYEDAIKSISKSIDLKNNWEISYFYRGVANQALEYYDDAMLDYTKAIQLNNTMTDAYYNRARIILTRKDIETPDYNKAVSDLEKALEQDEKFIDALYAIAVAHKNLVNYTTSVEYLDKLLEIEPQAINAKALKTLLIRKYIK